ncbi:MAG: hypothetical protein IJU51_00385, partial [Clostridia bacterium]|nr:hypothetical protein [Clostridia bacterium]
RPLPQNSPPNCFGVHPLRSAEAKSVSLSAESESRGTFAEKFPLTIPENELFPFLVSRIQVIV